MNSLAIKFDDHAINLTFTKDSLHFFLADGREVLAPIEWFPRLRDANDSDRNNWRFIGNGLGVHWPSLDEDISVRSIIRGSDS